MIDAIETKDSTARPVDLTAFLSKIDASKFYSYDGSLTTPPCTEGLRWSVLKQVMNISKSQLRIFTQHLADNEYFAGGNGNNRALQPINARTLNLAM